MMVKVDMTYIAKMSTNLSVDHHLDKTSALSWVLVVGIDRATTRIPHQHCHFGLIWVTKSVMAQLSFLSELLSRARRSAGYRGCWSEPHPELTSSRSFFLLKVECPHGSLDIGLHLGSS